MLLLHVTNLIFEVTVYHLDNLQQFALLALVNSCRSDAQIRVTLMANSSLDVALLIPHGHIVLKEHFYHCLSFYQQPLPTSLLQKFSVASPRIMLLPSECF